MTTSLPRFRERRSPSVAGALLVAGAAFGGCDAVPSPEAAPIAPPVATAEGTIAFVNVNVVPMDSERVLESQTVIVDGNRIARVGPADEVEVPEDATVIDGRGKWLIPGLGEMHAHVPAGEAAEQVLFLYLSQGVTTARGMLGQPAHLEMRERLAAGDLLGPRLYTTGPSLNGNSIPDPDSARRAVRHQKEMGYDLLKIHPGLSRAAYDAIVETANEVGILWAGHVPAAVGLDRALEARQATIDHLDQYMEAIVVDGTDTSQSLWFGLNLTGFVDETKIAEVAERTAAAGVWNVPTQSLLENVVLPEDPEALAQRPEMRYMPRQTIAQWVEAKTGTLQHVLYDAEAARRFIEVRRRLIKALADAGAPLLLGSDAPQIFQVPGFSILQEMEIMVAAGLSPYETLRAGSHNVAQYFGALDRFGTIEEGKEADLILLEANPLDDIGAVRRRAGVMARGRWLSAEEIDSRLEAIAAANAD